MPKPIFQTQAKIIRATTSTVAKYCKIQKIVHFNQKYTHINEYKIVHKCKSATIIMHICSVTVDLHLIFYQFFLSPSLHSLSLWYFSL